MKSIRLYHPHTHEGIAYDPPPHPRLKRRELDTAELMLMFRQASLPDVGERIPLSRLDGQDMIGLTVGGPVGDLFNDELRRHVSGLFDVVAFRQIALEDEARGHFQSLILRPKSIPVAT